MISGNGCSSCQRSQVSGSIATQNGIAFEDFFCNHVANELVNNDKTTDTLFKNIMFDIDKLTDKARVEV